MNELRALLRFVMSHKLKYLVFLIALVLSVPLLFPYGDVGDMVGAQVAKLTQNQVFLQFDRLNLGIFPGPSIGVENVSVETAMFPSISAQQVEVQPSWGAIITQKPSGTLIATGLFRGDVTIDLKPGKRTEAGVQTHALAVQAKSLSLAEINKVAELPIILKGKLNLTTSGTADPSLQEQPDFDIELKVDQLEIPASTVNTMMGPMNLPELKLSSVEIKGRLSAGRLNIERGQIGKSSDELNGTVKGGISLLVRNQGGLRPIIGAYNFDIDLNIRQSFQNKVGAFMTLLDSYKTPTADGARYQFRVNAASPNLPPSITALH